MSFAADLKGFVSGFEKGWKMAEGNEAAAERRQARQDALNAKDPNYMTPTERAEFERTRGRGALPTTNADGSPTTTGSTGGAVTNDRQLEAARKAISTIESGSAEGNYGATGPDVKRKDGSIAHAIGRYQVMDFNIPSWTQKHLGKAMTVDEFRKDHAAQDKVFTGEFGDYMRKYGPERAARAWYGGEGSVDKTNVKDPASGGQTTGTYGSRFGKLFASYMGDAPSVAGAQSDQGIPTQTAQSGATTSTAPATTGAAPISQSDEPAGAAGGLGERAKGVNPILLRVANRALQDSPGLFVVNPETEQVRTPQQQDEYVKKGWSKTQNSYHLAGNALDIIPINPKTGQPDKNYQEGYQKIQGAMRSAAQQLGVKNLGWGGDFKSFKDNPHWELTGTSRSYAGAPPKPAAKPAATAGIPAPPRRPVADATGIKVNLPAGDPSTVRADVGPGAPAPVTYADASDVLAEPPLDEEYPMARPPTTFARRGGAIPAPAQRFRRGGPIQRFVTGGTPVTAATYGSGGEGMDIYEWTDENRRRESMGLEHLPKPERFRENPIYQSQRSGGPFIPEGAIGPDGTPYGSGLAAVYSSGYTPGKITMPDGTQVDPSVIAAQQKKAQDAWHWQQDVNRFNKMAGTAGDPRFVRPGTNAANSAATRWANENALPTGTSRQSVFQGRNWTPNQGNAWAGGEAPAGQGGAGGGGGAPAGGGGEWAAMGLNPQAMAGGRGGATGASSVRTGNTGAAGRMPAGGASASNINDVGKSPWNPGMSIENAIATPWAKQRQWEQYGSPNANTGMNMAGTYPAAAYAGSYMGPGMYGEEGGTVPDAEERNEMGHFYEGGAIPDGTLAYYHGGTVRYFQGGPVGGGVQRFEGGGAATSAMDEARERIMMRNGAYRQGLTAGDLARAKSDPSRYGPYYGDRPAAPAAAKPAPAKGKPGAGTKKEPPKKDVTTTGSTGDPTYPRNVDPDRMIRDEPAPGWPRNVDPDRMDRPNPANPALVAPPDTPNNAMDNPAFGDTSTLPFDPQRNPFDVQRGETPASRAAAIPAPQNLQPRRGVSTPPPPDPTLPTDPSRNPYDTQRTVMPPGPQNLRPRPGVSTPGEFPPAPAAPPPRTPRPPIGTPMVDPATGLPIDPRTGQPIQPRGPGLAGGGTVPHYQDGGAMLTEQDLMRQQSDPTRYGAEPGMPPPTAAPPAAPPGRGIPAPGGAQAAGSPAAPVAQDPAAANPASQGASQRPRPDGDSGYYQKPTREEIAALNKVGLDEIQRIIAGQSGDQQTTGSVGPAIGPDPRQQVAANAYGSNALAPSTQEMQAAYKTSDPEGKLSTDELQLKTLQDMHDFWLAQGNEQKARTAAAHVLLYGKKVASTSGAMALSAAEDGNLLQAAQWLSKGYAHIANGESVRFEQDPKDPTKITYWRVGPDGERTQEPATVGQREISDMAVAMANGSGWLQETVTAARGGRQGRTAAKGPGYEERSREENKAALAGLSAAGDELEAARESGDAGAIKAAETKFRTEYRKTLTTPSLGASAKPIAEQYMPDVIPKTPEKPSDTEQKEERQRVADEKELADAKAKVDAEPDPVKKKALQRDLDFIPINKQYDKAVAGQKRAVPSAQINSAIPPDLKGNERNTVRAAVEGILRGNNMTAVSAYDLVAAASDPALATQVNFKGGRMNVPGFGGVLINSDIGRLIADLHKARKTKGLVLNPAAVKEAPAVEEPVEEE